VIRAFGLAAVVVGLGTAGCGGDSSGETTAPISIPPITSPIAPTTTAPATNTTRTGSTTTSKRGNGGNKFNPNLPDSETNDVPAPAGSPQETFEKQCEQNPRACG
jgi:hypothetical protein